MKITKNNYKLFRKLDDLIPTLEEISNIFLSQGNNELNNVLKTIFGEELLPLYINYLARSKNKALSSLVKSLFDYYGAIYKDGYYTLSNDGVNQLLSILKYRFLTKWNKLYNTLNLNYNPIKPYDMTIIEDSQDKMIADTETESSSSSTSENNETNENISNNNNDVYGFNSTTSVPSDKNNSSSTDNSTYNSTDTNNKEISIGYDRTTEIDKTITRQGNIGNTTQQELIERERNVWQYQIMDTIFNDLDSVFTRSKYI